MSNSFSHFVLLGAGSAANFDAQIQNSFCATLVEARVSAAQQLKARYNKPQIKILETLVSDQVSNCTFSHYNLPEFSAIQPADGLLQLYPGLKVTAQEPMTTEAVQNIIAELKLSDHNNALAIDILDINLRLLQALQSHELLALFHTLFIKTSNVALYAGAGTKSEVVQFLEQHGYSLQTIDASDPDMPNLVFASNPLWKNIQSLQAENAKLKASLEEAQIESNRQKQAVVNAAQELTTVKQELSKVHQTLNALEQDLKSAREEIIVQQQAKEALIKANASAASPELEIKYKQLISDNEALSQRIAELDSSHTQSISDLNKKLQECEDKYLQATEALSKCEEILKDKIHWLTEHEKWNNGLKGELDQKNNEISFLKKDLADKELKIKESHSNIDSLKAQFEEQKFINSKLVIETGKLESQIELITKLVLNNRGF